VPGAPQVPSKTVNINQPGVIPGAPVKLKKETMRISLPPKPAIPVGGAAPVSRPALNVTRPLGTPAPQSFNPPPAPPKAPAAPVPPAPAIKPGAPQIPSPPAAHAPVPAVSAPVLTKPAVPAPAIAAPVKPGVPQPKPMAASAGAPIKATGAAQPQGGGNGLAIAAAVLSVISFAINLFGYLKDI
jgi:hypothetical protein